MNRFVTLSVRFRRTEEPALSRSAQEAGYDSVTHWLRDLVVGGGVAAPRPAADRLCRECGGSLHRRKGNARFCSRSCQVKHYHRAGPSSSLPYPVVVHVPLYRFEAAQARAQAEEAGYQWVASWIRDLALGRIPGAAAFAAAGPDPGVLMELPADVAAELSRRADQAGSGDVGEWLRELLAWVGASPAGSR